MMFAFEILGMVLFLFNFNPPHMEHVTVSVIRSHFVGDSSLCARLLLFLVLWVVRVAVMVIGGEGGCNGGWNDR
jgi:hypothetical protein